MTKKILVLSHSSEIGGAELSMLDFFSHWQQKDSALELLFIIKAPAGELAKRLSDKGWGIAPLKYSSWVMPQAITRPEDILRNARLNTAAVKSIEKIIKDFQPDMVMTNTIIAPWAAFAAKLQGIKHLWFVREYGDLDHGHTFQIGKKQTYQDMNLLSEMVVTNSVALAKSTQVLMGRADVKVLYTPFNIANFDAQAAESPKNPFSKKADLRAVIVGVVKPSKGQELAIEAVSVLKKKDIRVELCIIGEANPQYKPIITDMARNLGVSDQIKFVGRKLKPLSYVKYADVGIMASSMEAFGRTTFEYLYMGKPVVGAATGGTLEMVENDLNGYLFEGGSSSDLANKLELYCSKEGRKKLKIHSAKARLKSKDMLYGEHGADKLIEAIDRQMAIDTNLSYKLPNFTREWLALPEYINKISGSRPPSFFRRLKRAGVKGVYRKLKGMLVVLRLRTQRIWKR